MFACWCHDMRVHLPCQKQVLTLAAADILGLVQVQMKACASSQMLSSGWNVEPRQEKQT